MGKGPEQSINFVTCHDNELNWFDWELVEKNADIYRFVKKLTRFRLSLPVYASTIVGSMASNLTSLCIPPRENSILVGKGFSIRGRTRPSFRRCTVCVSLSSLMWPIPMPLTFSL